MICILQIVKPRREKSTTEIHLRYDNPAIAVALAPHRNQRPSSVAADPRVHTTGNIAPEQLVEYSFGVRCLIHLHFLPLAPASGSH